VGWGSCNGDRPARWSEPVSRAGVAPADVQRLSRRTVTPTTVLKAKLTPEPLGRVPPRWCARTEHLSRRLQDFHREMKLSSGEIAQSKRLQRVVYVLDSGDQVRQLRESLQLQGLMAMATRGSLTCETQEPTRIPPGSRTPRKSAPHRSPIPEPSSHELANEHIVMRALCDTPTGTHSKRHRRHSHRISISTQSWLRPKQQAPVHRRPPSHVAPSMPPRRLRPRP
jgi:hypothetical protein